MAFTYSGRASRIEFWPVYTTIVVWKLLTLSIFVVPILFSPLSSLASWPYWLSQALLYNLGVHDNILTFLVWALVILPLTVRRLHDIGWSGWWLALVAAIDVLGGCLSVLATAHWVVAHLPETVRYLIAFMIFVMPPLVGIAVISLCALPGASGENRYGMPSARLVPTH